MDGSTDVKKRQDLVFQFNADTNLDVFLLTTNVGGLGLNLTGADVVIFIDHDWNPMKDIQAMDRAHRLGQTKVVNVYRLIMRNTLEEKIMGLQRFKLNVANTIINEENSGGGLKSMDDSEILDLFNRGDESMTGKRSTREADSSSDDPTTSKKTRALGGVAGLSAQVLAELDRVSEESEQQYDQAFDFSAYLNKYTGASTSSKAKSTNQ
jgi:TATA-binding protein-associated factor